MNASYDTLLSFWITKETQVEKTPPQSWIISTCKCSCCAHPSSQAPSKSVFVVQDCCRIWHFHSKRRAKKLPSNLSLVEKMWSLGYWLTLAPTGSRVLLPAASAGSKKKNLSAFVSFELWLCCGRFSGIKGSTAVFLLGIAASSQACRRELCNCIRRVCHDLKRPN